MNENSNNNNMSVVVDNITKAIPVVLAFLMPLFFLSTTTEFFEFNKLALLTIGTLLLVALWAVKILTGQKLEFVKSILDLPLLAFTVVMGLATVFSIHKTTSIYGSQGRWFPSLYALGIMLAYFFFSMPVLKEPKVIKQALFALIGASTLSSFISILSYYNIYIGSSDFLKIQSFTTTGSITTASVLAAVAAVVALGLIAYEELMPSKMALSAVAAVNFFFIALVSTFAGWIALLVGIVAVLLLIDATKVANNRVNYLALSGVIAALLMIMFLPTTRNVLVSKNYPQELTLPLRESWVVAASSIQDYPLLATGPSTFALNFNKYRPLSLNNGNTWNVRFDKPYNELLNILATLGIIGIVATIFIGLKLAKVVNASRLMKDESGMTKIATAALLGVAATFFVTYATVLNTFLFFLLLGIVLASQAVLGDSNKTSEIVAFQVGSLSPVSTIGGDMGVVKKEYFRYILAIPLIAAIGYVGYLFYQNYLGEYYMRQAIVAASNNDATKIYEDQRLAITANPTRDAYQSAYARTNLVLANALASKQNLTDQDKQTIQGLIAQAIQSARVVTEVVNPQDVANWETRAVVYSSLVGIAQNASDWAISSYNTAIQLDPTNPRLRLDLGGIYFANKDYLTAANLFRQATTLKGDYANAHYNFAQALIQLNDAQGAINELKVAQSLVPQGSDDFNKVQQQIDQLNALIQQANAAAAANQKPTVEQLTGQKAATTNQEPLTNASDQNAAAGKQLNLKALPSPTPTPVATRTPTGTGTPTPTATPVQNK